MEWNCMVGQKGAKNEEALFLEATLTASATAGLDSPQMRRNAGHITSSRASWQASEEDMDFARAIGGPRCCKAVNGT
jgi:hypothetical protein